MSFSITGTGSVLPQKTVSNDDLAQFLDTSDEWIRTRTGIQRRHVLSGTETVTNLSAQAARLAMENAGVTPDEIDYVLCATIGGDFLTPSLACMVQSEIGASCPALDVNAACSGFVYALDVAAGLFARGKAKKMLLVASEGLSRISDFTDRSTCVLFGDGASAVVLEAGDDLLETRLTSNGWSSPLYAPFPQGNFPGRDNSGPLPYLKMQGQEVYKFAVNAIVQGSAAILEQAGITEDQVDFVFLHQANLRIIEAAQKKLNIPAERYAVNIQEVGNTSSASIPLLLDEYNRAGKLKPGQLLLLNAFGAGLTTGSALLRWKISYNQ